MQYRVSTDLGAPLGVLQQLQQCKLHATVATCDRSLSITNARRLEGRIKRFPPNVYITRPSKTRRHLYTVPSIQQYSLSKLIVKTKNQNYCYYYSSSILINEWVTGCLRKPLHDICRESRVTR